MIVPPLLNKGSVQLALLMEAKGWTEAYVSQETGVAQTTVNGWLHARFLPRREARALLRTLTDGRIALGNWNEEATHEEAALWVQAMANRCAPSGA